MFALLLLAACSFVDSTTDTTPTTEVSRDRRQGVVDDGTTQIVTIAGTRVFNMCWQHPIAFVFEKRSTVIPFSCGGLNTTFSSGFLNDRRITALRTVDEPGQYSFHIYKTQYGGWHRVNFNDCEDPVTVTISADRESATVEGCGRLNPELVENIHQVQFVTDTN